jgi:predicted TPR repeat methyltransferase
MMLGMGHEDPRHCAEIAKEVLGEAAAKAKIFDIGCGSGLIGVEMKKIGVGREIVGVDASQSMLEEARKKNCYTNLQKLFLGDPEKFPEEHRNKYDIIGCTGVLAEGHLTSSVFDEMLLALKQGGHAIFSTREKYLSLYGYGPAIQKHIDDGHWEFVSKREFKKYDKIPEGENIGRFLCNNGMIYCYKKL